MKRYYIAAFICMMYIVAFCMYVKELASMHTEMEITIPIITIALSILVLFISLIIKFIKHLPNKFFWIPAMVCISGLITLFIGYNTPCCIGG